MKEIPLTQGKVALVDDEDYDFLTKWNWHALIMKMGNTYAYRSEYVDGKQVRIAMHREIMRAETAYVVDHINSNGLDNRRENLRLARQHQNACNRRKNSASSSKFKGVHLQRGKWISSIKRNAKTTYLGTHCSEIEAARAYNAAALKYHGEFAHLNRIPLYHQFTNPIP